MTPKQKTRAKSLSAVVMAQRFSHPELTPADWEAIFAEALVAVAVTFAEAAKDLFSGLAREALVAVAVTFAEAAKDLFSGLAREMRNAQKSKTI